VFCDCCCVFEWDGSFPFVAFSGHDRRPRLKRSEREGGTEGRKEGRKEGGLHFGRRNHGFPRV
jgi:hypothetical protein